MILPSDADFPPDRNEGKDADASPWWESPDLSTPDNDDEEPEDDSDLSYLGDPDDPENLATELASVAGPGWRKALYRELVDSLIQLEAIEDPDDDFDPPEAPDLYTFYGELAALRNELRLQSSANLNQPSKTPAPASSSAHPKGAGVPDPAVAWPVGNCLALLSLWDLLPHSAERETTFLPLLGAAGLTRISTADQPFDPSTMTIAGYEKSPGHAPHLILREITAGFLRQGTLLRPAAVIVTS